MKLIGTMTGVLSGVGGIFPDIGIDMTDFFLPFFPAIRHNRSFASSVQHGTPAAMRLINTPFPEVINSGNACLQGISVWHEKKIGISDSASITYNRGWRVHAGYQKF